MVELHVLTGRRAGTIWPMSGDSARIGRAPDSDLHLDDPGVWEQHLELAVRPGEGVTVLLLPPALATLNGSHFTDSFLRNGDELELGSTRLAFWLSAPVQHTFRAREALTWLALALLGLLQVGLIFWFTR